ncbi:methyltransferase [Lentzea sp. NPDC004782]|uniref:methyltransferase n=1 Tax=Lentzea sp. NPDC004782 TaxID=3154458 RepID=UPI0033B4861F
MLDHHDVQRLHATFDVAERAATEEFLTTVFDEEFTDKTKIIFDHAAVLVFPDHVDDVVEFCTAAGYEVAEPFPSMVVRGRLARRYGVTEQDLDVMIVRARPQSRGCGGVEIFVLPRRFATAHSRLVAKERATEAESHLGWFVDADSVEAVWRCCLQYFGMRPDGGGYNPVENSAEDGRTVLYFQHDDGASVAAHARRMELTADGHHAAVLAAHQSATVEVPDQHTALLSMLAGHWAARALHVAAEIGLADVLDREPLHAADVAERTGCDPVAVGRLLRFLDRKGVVRQLGDATYANTELGELLREANPFSDLVRLYGSDFYEAWEEFGATVRTGGTAFRHRHGAEHFDYFAQDEASARAFDRAMQAVTELVADELAKGYPFPHGVTVVDVGGGNGTLMRAVLRDHPSVSAVVFDRDHVSAHAAGEREPDSRFHVVSGDFFTEVPPEGDVYVLSRVLHDWSDEDCERILARCRAACRAGAKLLVLERFLPETGAPRRDGELGALWDLQMLAITGGRERECSEYEKLLHGAGFRVDDVRPLPTEMNLLIATAC